jgi:hypothetical protein
MGYFDNLDNGPLNKYKKKLKIEKKIIDVFFYLYIDVHSNFIQFHYDNEMFMQFTMVPI